MKNNEDKTLQKQLSPSHVWALAFGCIVGWGSFVNPGKKFLPNSGVAGTAIAMALGAIVMIIIAFSYAYMILFFAMPRGVYSQLFIGPSSFVSLLYHSHTHFSRWQNHRSSRRFFGQGAENCNFSRFSLYKSEALCYTEYVVRLKEADFFFFCGKNRPPSCKGRKNMLY